MLLEKKSGDKIYQCVLLRLQKIGQTSNGGVFARGTVQDNSTIVNFISFERQVAETIRNLPNPCAVQVFGVIQPDKYSTDDAIQFLLERVEILEQEADLSSIMPVTPKDIEEYKRKLQEIIDDIRKTHLRLLLVKIFNPEILCRFVNNPAAMRLHHAYIGGLLEHSVEAALIVKALSVAIKDIAINWDLAIAGALLHDIGKIDELSCNIGFDYTDSGRMLGHIILGTVFVKNAIAQIADFPAVEAEALLHVMVSHHGAPEKGSPIACVTPESFIVNYADEINATLNQFSILKKSDKSEWQYSRMLNRQLRLPGV